MFSITNLMIICDVILQCSTTREGSAFLGYYIVVCKMNIQYTIPWVYYSFKIQQISPNSKGYPRICFFYIGLQRWSILFIHCSTTHIWKWFVNLSIYTGSGKRQMVSSTSLWVFVCRWSNLQCHISWVFCGKCSKKSLENWQVQNQVVYFT